LEEGEIVNHKLNTLVSVLLLASMVLAGCASASPAAAPATEVPPTQPSVTQVAGSCTPPAPFDPATASMPANPKSITIALSQEPDNQNSLFSSMSYVAWIGQMNLIGLGKWDDKNNFVPDLAAEIPTADNGGVSADGLTVTWKLKPCLFWSDGQPITSKDVLYTWQAMVDPQNAPYTRTGYNQITGIDTPDDQTAVIHFKSPYAAWSTLFTQGPNNNGSLLPAHLLQGHEGLEKDPFIHQPTIASGPFVIKDWVAGDHMTLVANPNYYQGHAKLDVINIKFVPDPETALAALKNGDVDLVPDFAESDIPTIQALEPNQHLRVDTTPFFEHLFFNLGITNSTIKDETGKVVGNSDVAGFCPFQDVNVRKAFMLATDRDTIVKTLLYGKTTVPASLWPNSVWYDTNLTPYPYDVNQANQLLDTAGYKAGGDGIRAGTCDGKPVKFSLGVETTTKQVRVDTMSALRDMYTKIGVELKPNAVPSGTFFGSYSEGADMTTGKFDMAIFTTGFYPDPYTDSFLCVSVPSKDNPSGDNDYHYCDQSGKTEQMFAALNASADPAARKTAVDAIQQYQYDQALFIPLYARANVYGYSDRFIFPPSSGFGGWSWDAFDYDVK
jgi:peptide/nickel transport system substrate-binding protein